MTIGRLDDIDGLVGLYQGQLRTRGNVLHRAGKTVVISRAQINVLGLEADGEHTAMYPNPLPESGLQQNLLMGAMNSDTRRQSSQSRVDASFFTQIPLLCALRSMDIAFNCASCGHPLEEFNECGICPKCRKIAFLASPRSVHKPEEVQTSVRGPKQLFLKA